MATNVVTYFKERTKKEMSGSFIIIWGGFFHDGLCDLKRSSERMNSKKYQALLYMIITYRLGQ